MHSLFGSFCLIRFAHLFCIITLRMQCSRIYVIPMTGAAIAIDDASPADTVLSVKERVFAANRKLPVRRQRLVYRPGPRGMEPLADDETLGGAGVAQNGSAELDVLLADLTTEEVEELGPQVWLCTVGSRTTAICCPALPLFAQVCLVMFITTCWSA